MTRSIDRVMMMLMVFGVAAGAAVAGTERHVPSQYPTIQDAIDAASNGDEIVVADGVYSGPGNTNVDLFGKDVVVRSSGGRDACTIDANPTAPSRVFLIENGETNAARIEGFTITNAGGVGSGGAIRCVGSSPRIVACRFIDNGVSSTSTDVALGGAISSDGGDPSIEDCLFESNSATGSGCDLMQQVPPLGSALGGAVFLRGGSPTVLRCTFVANETEVFEPISVAAGGAIATENVTGLRIESCTFDGNIASTSLGQQICLGSAEAGALSIDGGSGALVVNSLFINNEATSTNFGGRQTGAIRNTGWGTLVVNCTIADNPSGTSDAQVRNMTPGVITLHNCIVHSWSSPSVLGWGSPGNTQAQYSLIRGGWPGAGNITFVNADPEFVFGYRLDASSPAVDTGDNTAVPPGVVTDLVGLSRFHDHPEAPNIGLPDGVNPPVDMGAYERHVCPGDANDDGTVSIDDIVRIILDFDTEGLSNGGDVDGSGWVDVDDIVLAVLNFGPCPGL